MSQTQIKSTFSEGAGSKHERNLEDTITAVALAADDRHRAKQHVFKRVLKRNALLLAIGLSMSTIIHMGIGLDTDRVKLREYLIVLCAFLITCGIVLCSTIPPESFDLDVHIQEDKMSRRVVLVVIIMKQAADCYRTIAASELAGSLLHGVSCAAMLLWFLWEEARFTAYRPRFTTLATYFFILVGLQGGNTVDHGIYAAACHSNATDLSRKGTTSCSYGILPTLELAPTMVQMGVMNLCFLFVTAAAAIRQKRRWSKGYFGYSPTTSLYVSTYSCNFCYGVTRTVVGSMAMRAGADVGLPVLLQGLCYITPVTLVILLGRSRTFGLISRKFDASRAELDGAVLASLLDGQTLEPGMGWWLHHGRNDVARFPAPFDHNANWTLGSIVQVDRIHMRFAVSSRQRRRAVLAGRIAGDAARSLEHSAFASVYPRPSEGKRSDKNDQDTSDHVQSKARGPLQAVEHALGDAMHAVEHTVGSMFFNTKDRTGSTRVVPQLSAAELKARNAIEWFPLPPSCDVGLGGRAHALGLLQEARENMRAMDGKDLSLALLQRNNTTFVLPRKLKTREHIDYFVSHSWHDSPELKFAVMSAHKRHFVETRGRNPTYWFDRVCIDQNRITDGLKTLVVNVMACKKLLVVCGKTYVGRLWCVLELFALFSFCEDEESALAKIELLPILDEGDTRESILKDLVNFEIDDARCYDPNEERRLRDMMHAVGEERFVARVRTLGQRLRLAKDESRRFNINKRHSLRNMKNDGAIQVLKSLGGQAAQKVAGRG